MNELGRRRRNGIGALVILVALVAGGCAGSSTGGSGTGTPGTDNSDPQRNSCGQATVQLAWAGGGIACASPGPLAPGSPWPISIRGAAQAFRDFTGEKQLTFNVFGPYGSADSQVYEVSGDRLNEKGYFVSGAVSSKDGRVTAVWYSARVNDGPGKQVVASTAALKTAEDYLRSHSVDVSGLTSSVSPIDSGWEVTWEKVVGGTGTTPRVVVTVEWVTGTVVGFDASAAKTPDDGSRPIPTITRAQAEATALSATWFKSPVIEDARLRLLDDGGGSPRLEWVIYVSGVGDNPDLPAYTEVQIDALTGEVTK